jgi:DNA polymerase-3 subunit epsilon/CBS domain-containing protein
MNGGGATPLIGLDGVVIDCETTGLDPAKAFVVDLAGVRVIGGRLDVTAPFQSLVRPPLPIPPTATSVHGIDDAAVAEAPPLSEIWPAFKAFAGGAVVIGHSIGFDLAVLKRECERAGLPWSRPRSLCTRLLGQVIAPDLPGHSLEQLGAWLGVSGPEGRHSALGDATYAAKIFLALLPRLRERGVRTLAEAEQATWNLSHRIAEEHRAGWVEPVIVPGRDVVEPALADIDPYPYRHRVSAVMSSPPKIASPDTPAGEALQRMAREQVSSLLVVSPGKAATPFYPGDAGIVTERDMMRALAGHGASALAMPIDSLASRPLVTVYADAFIYRAISRMNRLRVRHLGVIGADGRICGVVSARDLLRLRAEAAIDLGDALDQAEDAGALARAWANVPQAAAALLAEDVPPAEVTAVISAELAMLTRRAGVLAERRLLEQGLGAPPCPYALSVLGSAGRGESLLAMDQDNMLVFAEGGPGGDADRWFAQFGTVVADILDEVGVPYCRGGVMAKSPAWRGSVATWQERVQGWIARSNPADLLSVDIFFDLRAVHGDLALGEKLWRDGFDLARGQAGFAKLLAEAAGEVERGHNLFGGFRTVEGRIDLKRAGLFGIVTTARVLAICHHVVERSTVARLSGVAALEIGGESDLAALIEAQRTFLDLILAQQLRDIAQGRPPSNRVATRPLVRHDRDRLHQALAAVRHLDELTRDLLFRD